MLNFRAIAQLISGSVAAQLISLLFSPLLARLFSPADFGELAGFMGVVAIASIIASGRFEWAMMVSRGGLTTVGLMRLLVALAFTVSVLMSLLVLVGLNYELADSAVLSLCGVSALFVAADRGMSSWLARDGVFRLVATTRVVQAAVTNSVQLIFGFLGLGIIGLVTGQLAGQAFSLCLLRKGLPTRRIFHISRRAVRACVGMARRYRRYPMVVMPGSLVNEGASQLPLFIILAAYSPESAGLFAMVQRLLTAPVSLLASAVSDVFRSEAAKAFRERGECLLVLRRYITVVLPLAFTISTVVYLIGGQCIAWLFGSGWGGVESVTRAMTFLMFGQLLALPFAQTAVLAGLHGLDASWNIIRFLSIAVTLAGCVFIKMEFLETLMVFSSLSLALHILHLLLQFYAASGRALEQR